MKWLKRIGIFLATLVVVYLILALVGPRRFDIERSATVATTPERARAYLADFHNFPAWSPWEGMDTTLQHSFSGAQSGVGAEYSWTSQNIGAGRMVIIEDTPTLIRIALFFDNTPDTNIAYFRIEPVADSVKVTWGMDGPIDFAWRPMALLFMNRMIAEAYQNGMDNVKRILEATPPPVAFAVVETPAVKIVTIRKKCPTAQIGPTLGELYGKIGDYLAAQSVTMDANQPPFAIYHSFSPQEVELEAGFVVGQAVPSRGDIKFREVAAGRALRGTHTGPYSQTETTHRAMQAHASQNSLSLALTPWEFYVTDPGAEPDSTKWKTDIYYPIQ
jgi:effector-binding domain-containing protein